MKIAKRRNVMEFWDKIKVDIQKGIREGIGLVKEGVSVVRDAAEELTEEGKKKLRMFELKTKVQREISELGGRVYAMRTKTKNPMSDSKVKAILSRIVKIEARIDKLDGQSKGRPAKTAAKKAAPKQRSKAQKKTMRI
jgi:hypothetical protein